MRLPRPHELNGWQRLWVVGAGLGLLALLLLVLTQGAAHHWSEWVTMLALWFATLLAVYGLGLAVTWIVGGFRHPPRRDDR